MNPEIVESSIRDHSENLIRLDERIRALDGIDKRVSRLNNYLQICGVVLLVLGIGGGFLVSRFLDAQRKIGELSAQVADAQLKLSGQLTQAKKDFDNHVGQNPVVATLQAKVAGFETAFATADPARSGVQDPQPRRGDEGVDMITCPQGTYMYGIRVDWNKGSGHGIVHHVHLLYKPFLSR